MKITVDNYKKYIPEKDQNLLYALLIDLDEINKELENNDHDERTLFIDYITEHTDYSPERTEPCPDYYGMYLLRFEYGYDHIGVEMDIDTLDTVLCTLNNFVVI